MKLMRTTAGSCGVIMMLVAEPVSCQLQPQQPEQCGTNCLFVALEMLDFAPQSVREIEAYLGEPTARGYSIWQLQDAARHFGGQTAAVRTTPANLIGRREAFACIALLGGTHFVLIRNIVDGEVDIVDPPRRYTVPLSTLLHQWDGTALLIANTELEREEQLTRRLRVDTVRRTAIVVGLVLLACLISLLVAKSAFRRLWK
jgi:ABC-type bacteriocin/lantibiotic exporter with double-glycine peptidase domain